MPSAAEGINLTACHFLYWRSSKSLDLLLTLIILSFNLLSHFIELEILSSISSAQLSSICACSTLFLANLSHAIVLLALAMNNLCFFRVFR